MKFRKFLSLALAAVMLVSMMSTGALAAPLIASATKDLDEIESLEIDWTQASQLPLTGSFTKAVGEDGRTARIYIASEASIRTYFTVVAVPDGVDTDTFLKDNGWIALADAKGEGLLALEPGTNGWGTAEEESAYVNGAIGFLRSNGTNANGVSTLSTFGEFYLAGYGKGADALELWAAENPILVISQVFVDGTGVAADKLAELGAAKYDGVKAGGYADIPDFEGTLKRVGMTQITKADVPVPTWFVNSNGENVAYWKAANDCVEQADANGVYHQDIASDALQTEHANAEALKLNADEAYGISQVKVSKGTPKADEIYAFLSTYTRYENSFAYANTLAYRVDYTAARVGAQKQAAEGKVIATYPSVDCEGKAVEVTVLGQATTDVKTQGGAAKVQVGVFAFSDNNEDGKNDPREYLVYVPQGFEGKLPVLMVYPGNTQTDGIFFDCTQWYQVADREGIALVFVNETYSGPTAITHVDAQYYQTAMMTVLEKEIDGKLASLDFERVYGTGQSLGSMTTQRMARVYPEFFAAVASTSGVGVVEFGTDANQMIPTFMLTGQSDLEFLLPDLWQAANLPDWANYFIKANGIQGTIDDGAYTAAKINSFDRVDLYTWKNADGVPMLQWGQTMMRAHNCYAGEMQLMWDYLKDFSFKKAEDGTITRYYQGQEISVPAPKAEFSDVSANDWFAKAVNYAVEKNIMAGVAKDKFAPQTTASRAMVVQMLYAMAGKPEAASAGFADVKDGDWYAEAVGWAKENNIVGGVSETAFAPNQAITREQLAVILYGYVKSQGGGFQGTWMFSMDFSDVDQIHDWANVAMHWCVMKGLFSGKDGGKLDPLGSTTRAELAQVMMNFCELDVK